MRIVIDMQAAQTGNLLSGSGQFTVAFSQAVVRNRGSHEVFLALNGMLLGTIEPLRAAFEGLLPQENIRLWYAPGPVKAASVGNEGRREVAELVREAFLASLQPDIIHISNFFDGYDNEAVASICCFDKVTPTSVFVHDHLLFDENDFSFINKDSRKKYFDSKIDQLKKSVLCFSVLEDVTNSISKYLLNSQTKIITLQEPLGESIRSLGKGNGRFQKKYENSFVGLISAIDQENWNKHAVDALDAFATIVAERQACVYPIMTKRRPRLAFVTPLPPERTGIADYSAMLLPELARYYDIDVIVTQSQVDLPGGSQLFGIRDVEWLRSHVDEIERVLYHLGNSPFHKHVIYLLKEIPGVVVLHDFFIGHLKALIQEVDVPNFWVNDLYSAHGYHSVRDYYRDPESVKFNYPASFDIFQYAQGVIVHSHFARELANHWYGKNSAGKVKVIPLLRSPARKTDNSTSRIRIGINEDDFIVCSFGFLGPTKLDHRLFDCWLKSALSKDKHTFLVFVGENNYGEYGEHLLREIKNYGDNGRVSITGYVNPETYQDYLAAADMAVQLRSQSRGETSASVLDCMNHGLPVIANADGSLAELDPQSVWLLPAEFEDTELIEGLETLWRDSGQRALLSSRARKIIENRHAPAHCAHLYVDAIEHCHRRSMVGISSLINTVATSRQFNTNDVDLFNLSEMVAATLPPLQPAKHLFLDVSATCRNDLKTGIQRVTRALVAELLQCPPKGFRVEPVYFTDQGGLKWHYRHARRWTAQLLDFPSGALIDEPVDYVSGDLMVVVDFTGSFAVEGERSGVFQSLRNHGVGLHFVVYDLLPILLPDVFPPNQFGYSDWLETVNHTADSVLCISRAVAGAFRHYTRNFQREGFRPIRIGWFHLGADIGSSKPSLGLPNDFEEKINIFGKKISFLMVGTIEPRKGHLQVLDAFDQLWKQGVDIQLIVVGNAGWSHLSDDLRRNIPETINRLCFHPELNSRLFWLEGISDEYLEKVYSASTCLIAASYGEGFGLPLIEAAQHNLPIIARDIPVFREVAGEHAFYFEGKTVSDFAQSVLAWLDLYAGCRHPKSDNMPWLTWKESAEQLLQCVLQDDVVNPKAG